MSTFSQSGKYETCFEPTFEDHFQKIRDLIVSAKREAAFDVRGSASRIDYVLAIDQSFTTYVAEMKAMIENGRFGDLPPILDDFGIPMGASKHFSGYGWMTTIILDVPQQIAYFHYLEPSENMRKILTELASSNIRM